MAKVAIEKRIKYANSVKMLIQIFKPLPNTPCFNSLPNENKKIRLLQIESICRRQYRYESKNEILFWKDTKHCGKWKNAGYQYFPFFPQCFQTPSISGQ